MRVIGKWVLIAVVVFVLFTQTDRALSAIGGVLSKLGDFALRALESVGGTIYLEPLVDVVKLFVTLGG